MESMLSSTIPPLIANGISVTLTCVLLALFDLSLIHIQMCIRDSPKSERGNWKETLPEIAHEINIVNLTSDKMCIRDRYYFDFEAYASHLLENRRYLVTAHAVFELPEQEKRWCL